MKRKEILHRLEERLARGEISEKTYLGIKARYEAEPAEPEEVEAVPPPIAEAVSRIHEDVARVTEEAMKAVGEAMRAVDFSGIGVKLSEEAF